MRNLEDTELAGPFDTIRAFVVLLLFGSFQVGPVHSQVGDLDYSLSHGRESQVAAFRKCLEMQAQVPSTVDEVMLAAGECLPDDDLRSGAVASGRALVEYQALRRDRSSPDTRIFMFLDLVRPEFHQELMSLELGRAIENGRSTDLFVESIAYHAGRFAAEAKHCCTEDWSDEGTSCTWPSLGAATLHSILFGNAGEPVDFLSLIRVYDSNSHCNALFARRSSRPE
ncbi:hypothetical protein [Halomonas denitrificans]|nr:hypothetical protein [Halomonas denitrificans]